MFHVKHRDHPRTTSHISRAINAHTTTMKARRTNAAPFLIARWEPSQAPARLASAIVAATFTMIAPAGTNQASAARFVLTLTTFAAADARRKSHA
jgi:hypothetical protein